MSRRGFVLVSVVIALTVVGLLIASALFVAVHERRTGVGMIRLVQAANAAEAGLSKALPALRGSRAPRVTIEDRVVGGGWFRGWVDSIAPGLFLTVVEGFTSDSFARQRYGAMITRRSPVLGTTEGVVARGPVVAGQGAAFEVAPCAVSPVSWVLEPHVSIDSSDCSGCLEEVEFSVAEFPPPIFTPTDYAAVVEIADKRFQGGSLTGVGPRTSQDGCEETDLLNWGDPTGQGACGGYLPVVYSSGTLQLGSGSGQGVLLVDGDLVVEGPFSYHGIVVTSGSLELRGPGAEIHGSVEVGGMTIRSPAPWMTAKIVASDCATRRAVSALDLWEKLPGWNWLDLN